MKTQYTLLQKEISPSLTILFKETNPYHPDIISDGKGFAIVIEDWEKGIYRFVNSAEEKDRINNEHFTPNNAQPILKIKDLNNLWRTITGDQLTYIGNPAEKIEIGKIYPTKRNGYLKVIEILENNKCKVRFENGYEVVTQIGNVRRRSVRNPYHPSVFKVGYIGEGKYDSTTKDVYDRWRGMLQRCYDEKSRHLYKSYAGTTVCEEWKCLQNFGVWYEANYKADIMKGWDLDKDVLGGESKIYSPETCCFVPAPINNVLVKASGVDNGYPTGVVKEGQKYYACFYRRGEPYKSKSCNTIEEASTTYAFEKDKYICELVEEFKYGLDPRACDKLINYRTKVFNENIEYTNL